MSEQLEKSGKSGASKRRADEREAKERGLPRLALTVGDPCGIGGEVVLKALASEQVGRLARVVVCGDEKCLRREARSLKLKWPFAAVVREFPPGAGWDKPVLLDLGNVDESLVPGQVSALAGKAAGEAIERAAGMALDGTVDGVVTAPIHKEALSLAGYHDRGHTEMFARLADTAPDDVGMLFFADEMSVGLLTTHLSLKEAVKKIRTGRVVSRLTLFDREWRRLVGRPPRIAVAALNPHAGESGRFGTEESIYLMPAIEKAREQEINVSDPIPADSVFVRARNGEFDLVLALYHDQATIPVKLLYGGEAVNVSVGLPFVRTSVDHGTAMEIAGKGIARAEGMLQAIRVAARFTSVRTDA